MKRHTVIILASAGLSALLLSCVSLNVRAGDTARADEPSDITGQSMTTGRRSIKRWASCNGKTDDSLGTARAFKAASHGAFTLVVDCPVRLKIGFDIARSIFIDDGTTVEFSGTGKFTVDNIFIPAFVIANSSHITLTNWNVEYDASLPIDASVNGYEQDGRFVRGSKPANAFNDLRITPWLASNRAIIFDRSHGRANSNWTGPTNACAVFFVSGDSSALRITGMHLYVPASSGGERFIPVAFSLNGNFKTKQTVTANTPMTGQYFAIPHDIRFSNITLDGTYMGWVGTSQDAVFEDIQSHRYGDLQDANGQNVGGIGKWFAPPHLFYLSYSPSGDPALFNSHIRIKNVVDDGPRIGVARDKGGGDSTSGNALSLKIGCVDCIVDSYKTKRPDGFLDVLPSNNMTISNAEATYDSGFLNNLYPGWRFPSSSYNSITFENIVLTDSAVSTIQRPIGDSKQAANQGIIFKNVRVSINRWEGQDPLPISTIAGSRNDLSVELTGRSDASQIMRSRKDATEVTLQATPTRSDVGRAVILKWNSQNADKCSAGGAWKGTFPTDGTRTIPLTENGAQDFTLNCQNADGSASANAHVVLQY